jgi:hypothetical protein
MKFLFPFLNMGLTMENFTDDGDIPVAKDQLHMLGLASCFFTLFNILV